MRSRSTAAWYNTCIIRALMIVVVAVITLSFPLAASAQILHGESFSTETGDHTVVWNKNWTAELYGEDDFSTMVMLEGQIMIYAVMFMHDPDLGLTEKAVYHSLSGVLVNSFDSTPTKSVEWEAGDGSFRGAHIIPISGIEFVLYLRVDPATDSTGPTMQFAAAPTRAFPVSLEAMQEELTLDGVPVFDGDNGEDVLERLDLSEKVESEVEPSSEAMPSDVSTDSSTATDRSRTARNAHLPAAARNQQVYISADTGFTVAWDDPWINMAETDSTVGEFSLIDDSGRIVVSFTGRATTETNREAFFQDIIARESRYSGFVDSLLQEDRLLIATWTAENELAVLEYIFVDDETVVTIMVTVTSNKPERYMENIELITLNGEPILQDFNELWADQED